MIWGFKKAVGHLEIEEINKNLLQDRISGEQLRELFTWFKLMEAEGEHED